MNKRILSIIVAAIMLLSLCGCGDNKKYTTDDKCQTIEDALVGNTYGYQEYGTTTNSGGQYMSFSTTPLDYYEFTFEENNKANFIKIEATLEVSQYYESRYPTRSLSETHRRTAEYSFSVKYDTVIEEYVLLLKKGKDQTSYVLTLDGDNVKSFYNERFTSEQYSKGDVLKHE